MDASQAYYASGPRAQQPRSLNHRGGQSASGTPVVGMASVGGAGGQPTGLYTHTHPHAQVPQATMYVQSQVSTMPHHTQQSVYPNHLPLQV